MRTVTYHSIRPFYIDNSHVIGREQRRCKMHLLVTRCGQNLYVNYVYGMGMHGGVVCRIHPVFSYRVKNVRVGRDVYRNYVKHGQQS